MRFEGVLAVLAQSADAHELRDVARNLCAAASALQVTGRRVEADRVLEQAAAIFEMHAFTQDRRRKNGATMEDLDIGNDS